MIFITSSIFGQEISVDKIAAIVNDDIILLSQVRENALQLKQLSNLQLNDNEYIKQALDTLILNKLQLQKAKDMGITVDNVALNQAMINLAQQNKLSLPKFRLALIKEGFNYKDFRETIRNKIYIDILQERRKNTNELISEREIDDLIKAESRSLSSNSSYHIIDIQIPFTHVNSVLKFNQSHKKAKLLRAKLVTSNLSTPNNISKELIKSTGTKATDLGWKQTKSLSPVFLTALSLINKGEISEVIRDSKGFHILKLIDKRGGKQTFDQQARVRHILISNPNNKSKTKILQIRKQIVSGSNFEKLAKKHSSDTGSAQNGGNLGLTNPNDFVAPFAQVVRTIPLNTLSLPIKTRFGWHILEVLERKVTDQTRQALKKKVEKIILEKNRVAKFNTWLQGLRDDAYIEYKI